MNYIEKVKNVFDRWALNGKADQIEVGHTYSVNQMLEFIDTSKEFRFLDIGCGNGWTVRRITMLPSCKYAYGIDISPEMIQLANKRKLNGKEYYICSDFCEWVYEGKFDIIFSMEALYYFIPIKGALHKIYESLNEKGMLIIGTDFYKENKVSATWPEMVGLDMQLESIIEWKDLLTKARFNDIRVMQIKDHNSQEEWKRNTGTLVICAMK